MIYIIKKLKRAFFKKQRQYHAEKSQLKSNVNSSLYRFFNDRLPQEALAFDNSKIEQRAGSTAKLCEMKLWEGFAELKNYSTPLKMQNEVPIK